MQTLTAAELLSMSSQRSPAEVELTCLYSVEQQEGNSQSPRSNVSYIHIKAERKRTSVASADSRSGDLTTATTKISDLPPPDLIVNPQLISEKDSVTLNCQTPVSLTECFWLFEGKSRAEQFSCSKTLTGAELITMTSQRVPAKVQVSCFYINGATSPKSEQKTITIQYVERKRTSVTSADSRSGDLTTGTPKISDLLPPDMIVNPQLISEKDSVTLNCQTPDSLTECFWLFEGKSRASRFSCSKTLTGAELITMTSQRVPAKVQVSCFYLNGDKSPKSEQKTITIQFPQPELRVNPAVITDRDSATLNCVTPSSLSVSECHFHFLRAKRTRISSCMQTLTAAELLSISSQRSPADIELTCLYSVEQQEGNSQSPHSNVSYIHINVERKRTSVTSADSRSGDLTTGTTKISDLLPPDLIVNPQLISEKDSVTLNCQTPVSLTECFWLFEGKSRAEEFSCSKTLTGAELITMTSQRVPAKVQVSCFYLNGATSPESEQKTITIQFPQPELRVNPAVITDRDSATLNCVTPSSLSVSECHFHFLRTKTTRISSCMQTLTAAELLVMSSQRSPADVELTCLYSVEQQEGNSQSPRSNVSYIRINLLPPDLIVNPQLISEKDSVTLNCQTPVSLTECFWLFEGKSRATRFSCSKTLTGAELIKMTSQRVPAKVQVSCFYLNGDKSPESEQKTITIQYPQPELRVNPAVITDRDSATLNCVTPSSLSVTQCYFYFLRTKTTRISSCMQTLTAAELLVMSSQRSPADVELTCLYSVEQQEGNSQSPLSNVSYIRINLLPPDLIVNPQLISEKDSVTLNCQTPVSLTECFWLFEGKSRATRFSCSKTLTGAELITMTSQRVPAKVQVSCFYLNGAISPKSEQKTITIQFPQPELRVNPAVITDRDSATLNCVTPSSLSVSECHFHFLRAKTTRISSCMQTLTAAELLSMSSQRSPAEVELTCLYPVEQQEGNSQSPHSNVSYIHITKASTTTQWTSPFRTTTVITTTTEEIILPSTTVGSESSTRRSLHTTLTSVNPQPAVTEETRTSTTTLLTSYVTSGTQTKEVNDKPEWKLFHLAAIGPGFGVTVGVILLVAILLCPKRRSKKYATSRHKVYSSANFLQTRNIHSEDQEMLELTPGPYNEITSVCMNSILPAVDCPAEFEQKDGLQSPNESSDVYHVYASIADEDPSPALRDVTYHKLQLT
ncbi:uncharacterized protein LOC112145138 [Oryzias melastigma]|uniref:uncharacterized protein LOC112145138 n=1 Tax=Oryzias melastigma TaxID=30732 RepID=UPI00168CF36D|nr:uncharacterized protein LOC112145138 [Oryzias melastigma]